MSIFEHAYPIIIKVTFNFPDPNFFKSTFNFHEFVLAGKKSGYFIILFYRYIWFKNSAIWLAKNILVYLKNQIFHKYEIC